MAKQIKVNNFIKKSKKKGKAKKTSNNKNSKSYKKEYVGQGR